MIKIEILKVGRMGCNCYIVYDTKEEKALIIDPGDDADFVVSKLNSLCVEPVKIIATHGHFDHNMAAYELQKAYSIPFMISEKDLFLIKKMPQSARYFLSINSVKVPKPDKFLVNNQKISMGKGFFKVMETPGHTPGGIALDNPIERVVFTGDTVFSDGAMGRYDFSYSSKKDLLSSISNILSLPKETIIYPGHGGKTTVGREIAYHVQ